MKVNKKIFNIYEVIVFMFITAIVSSLTCGMLMFKLYDGKEIRTIVKKDCSGVSENKHIVEFVESYERLKEKYYEEVDEGELIDSAIKGMLDHLGEPYTEYFDEDRAQDFNEQLQGNYEGVGVLISYDQVKKETYVLQVFENTPAERAGIEVGDVFLKINGEDVTDKDSLYISDKIKNGKEAASEIVFRRNDKEVTVKVTREVVTITSAFGKIMKKNGKNIGYLKITQFAIPTNEQVKKALKEFEEKKVKYVIVDLRSNQGGYLNSVLEVAENFLEKGKVILQLEDKKGKSNVVDSSLEKTNFKIVVLIDEISASAAEILAGALKQSYGATLVGKKTFGKGKFQETENLSSGASIKYTAGYWYTPDGTNVDGVGISPDVEVSQSEEYFEERTDESDAQLQKALELVIK